MKFSACIEMLFTEYPLIERIHKAGQCGFDAVEFWLWHNKDLDAIKRALDETGLEVGIFQANTEGRMVDGRDRDVYVAGVKTSIAAARKLGTKHLFLMTDVLKEDRTVLDPPEPISEDAKLDNVRAVLRVLKPIAEDAGVTLVIEPLNTIIDHRGYSLSHSKPAFDLVQELGSPHIKVLYDVYHMQIMEGNLIDTIRSNISSIGYVHIADVPGRHEPGTGEINFRIVLKTLRDLDYGGFVGWEFEPTGDSTNTVGDIFKII